MSRRRKRDDGSDRAQEAAVVETLAQDGKDNRLEIAIGRQVRQFRRQLELTVTEVAKLAELSSGMLSKIENGMTSPSLATLAGLVGLERMAEAIDACLTRLGETLKDPADVRALLLEGPR